MLVTPIWPDVRDCQPFSLMLVVLCTYVYGSIPFAYLATYLFARQSLTQEGTGNVGVINAFRTGGVPAVALTLLGEFSKAPVSVGLAQLFFPGQDAVKLVAILAAFVGTNFSLFLRGKGGRGSTMLMWSIALVSFYSFLILGAITGLCFILARVDVRLKSLWFWAIPVVLYLVEEDLAFLVFGILVVVVIYLKGRGSKDDFVYYGYVRDR
jgi:glycerol-3-phosphate acyltransferase PlsY